MRYGTMIKESKQPQSKKDRLWAEAKRRCCLNAVDVAAEQGTAIAHRSMAAIQILVTCLIVFITMELKTSICAVD